MKYQNKGIAQEVMKRLELMYPQAESWEIETINCLKNEIAIFMRKWAILKSENYSVLMISWHL